MRYKPGKRAIIIDHVNNIDRFGFPDRDREWLLEGHPHKKRGVGEQPLKICKNCFAAVPISTIVCPNCGEKFPAPEAAKTIDIKLMKINEAKQRVRFYLSPNECQSVEELSEYAKLHGYKPGWVYYQQKSRGWLNGPAKARNSDTKRYSCRAVPGWDSQAE